VTKFGLLGDRTHSQHNPLLMINRRQFLTLAAATTGLSLAPGLQSAAIATDHQSVLKPRRLQPGDTVGIISPATAIFRQEEIDIVVDAMSGLGLQSRIGNHVGDRYGYLGGEDGDRAADINEFFANPDIAALIPIRGGWGSSRVLPYLDYDLIRQNPKIIVGFSDITALLLGIYAKTGLVTFHGPNGYTGWRTQQTDYFRRTLFDGETLTYQNWPDSGDDSRLMQVGNRIQTITPGVARGKLIGGNLSVLSGIVGSPYVPDLNGAILFIEDVGETLYRVDRMMTQLKLAGLFDNLAGFIFGQCPNCLPDASYGSLTLEEIIQDHIQPLGIPAWTGAMIGHVETIVTLPIGGEVEIDATAGTIEMRSPAVQ